MTVRSSLVKTINSLAKILSGRPNIAPSLTENEMLQVILKRRSIRSFKPQPVADDVFQAILEAGRLAPSGVNLQSWTFAVFDNTLWQKTFGRSIPFHGERAVIIIADTYRYRQVFQEFPYSPLTEYTLSVINASLAAMNMNLAAEALGVSSVMLSETGRTGLLDAKYLKETLSLPDGAIPLMTIVFGYARGLYPQMPPKLSLEDILLHGKYRPTDPETMQSWLDQMTAGYNISHLGTNFKAQVALYERKVGQAEKDLRELVFYRPED